jgi:hypothetical protein
MLINFQLLAISRLITVPWWCKQPLQSTRPVHRWRILRLRIYQNRSVYARSRIAHHNNSLIGPACELVKSDTGCILSNSDSCGVLLTDGPFTGYCSGSETRYSLTLHAASITYSIANSGPTCSCLEGFWGPNCTYPCPGMEASGAGSICGGYVGKIMSTEDGSFHRECM